MNTKHTPCPWRLNSTGPEPWDLDVVDSHGRTIAEVGKWSEAPANARLMAAAPALLEALELVSAHDGRLTGADWLAITRALKQAKGE